MIDSYTAFMMMYYILDAAADELDSESVLNYASIANPFVFKDEGSADPAVYAAFKEAWDNKFGESNSVVPEDCKAFIKAYMEDRSKECLEAFNLVVDDATWEEDLKDVQEQTQERRDYIAGK